MEVGSTISSLSMLFFDSHFDKMRFRSDKEPTVNIKFNTLDRIKNLLFKSGKSDFVTETDNEDDENDHVQIVQNFNEENDVKVLKELA